MTEYVLNNFKESLPNRTPEFILAAISQVLTKFNKIQKIELVADKTGLSLNWDVYFPKQEPPDGEIPETPISNIWDTLTTIPLEHPEIKRSFNQEALNKIVNVLFNAKQDANIGTAIVVGSKDKFIKWLGLDSDIGNVLNMPIISLNALPDHNCVVLMAKGLIDPIQSSYGVVIDMEE
jgi:hypothetical protein